MRPLANVSRIRSSVLSLVRKSCSEAALSSDYMKWKDGLHEKIKRQVEGSHGLHSVSDSQLESQITPILTPTQDMLNTLHLHRFDNFIVVAALGGENDAQQSRDTGLSPSVALDQGKPSSFPKKPEDW